MKKSALSLAAAIAVASAGLMTAGNANAIVLAETADTKMTLGGRINMRLVNDDGDNSINGGGSRFNFRFDHTVNANLSVFANTEFRFNADEQTSTPFNNQRSSFLGANFAGVGRLYAGNFNSVYYNHVASVIDIPENAGARDLSSFGNQRSHGDSIAFESVSFDGLHFGGQIKHEDEGKTVSGDEEVNVMAYIGYRANGLNVAVAVDQANEDMGVRNNFGGDTLIGVRADYQVTPELNVGGLLELQGDLTHIGLTGVYNYGMGSIYGILSRLDFDGEADDLQYAAGVSYRFSRPMYVYAEFAGSTDAEVGGLDRNIVTLGARYNF